MARRLEGSRQHMLITRLNDRELKALEQHCRRYKIENKSRWIRHLLMQEIIHQAELDSPLLFEENEMR